MKFFTCVPDTHNTFISIHHGVVRYFDVPDPFGSRDGSPEHSGGGVRQPTPPPPPSSSSSSFSSSSNSSSSSREGNRTAAPSGGRRTHENRHKGGATSSIFSSSPGEPHPMRSQRKERASPPSSSSSSLSSHSSTSSSLSSCSSSSLSMLLTEFKHSLRQKINKDQGYSKIHNQRGTLISRSSNRRSRRKKRNVRSSHSSSCLGRNSSLSEKYSHYRHSSPLPTTSCSSIIGRGEAPPSPSRCQRTLLFPSWRLPACFYRPSRPPFSSSSSTTTRNRGGGERHQMGGTTFGGAPFSSLSFLPFSAASTCFSCANPSVYPCGSEGCVERKEKDEEDAWGGASEHERRRRSLCDDDVTTSRAKTKRIFTTPMVVIGIKGMMSRGGGEGGGHPRPSPPPYRHGSSFSSGRSSPPSPSFFSSSSFGLLAVLLIPTGELVYAPFGSEISNPPPLPSFSSCSTPHDAFSSSSVFSSGSFSEKRRKGGNHNHSTRTPPANTIMSSPSFALSTLLPGVTTVTWMRDSELVAVGTSSGWLKWYRIKCGNLPRNGWRVGNDAASTWSAFRKGMEKQQSEGRGEVEGTKGRWYEEHSPPPPIEREGEEAIFDVSREYFHGRSPHVEIIPLGSLRLGGVASSSHRHRPPQQQEEEKENEEEEKVGVQWRTSSSFATKAAERPHRRPRQPEGGEDSTDRGPRRFLPLLSSDHFPFNGHLAIASTAYLYIVSTDSAFQTATSSGATSSSTLFSSFILAKIALSVLPMTRAVRGVGDEEEEADEEDDEGRGTSHHHGHPPHHYRREERRSVFPSASSTPPSTTPFLSSHFGFPPTSSSSPSLLSPTGCFIYCHPLHPLIGVALSMRHSSRTTFSHFPPSLSSSLFSQHGYPARSLEEYVCGGWLYVISLEKAHPESSSDASLIWRRRRKGKDTPQFPPPSPFSSSSLYDDDEKNKEEDYSAIGKHPRNTIKSSKTRSEKTIEMNAWENVEQQKDAMEVHPFPTDVVKEGKREGDEGKKSGRDESRSDSASSVSFSSSSSTVIFSSETRGESHHWESEQEEEKEEKYPVKTFRSRPFSSCSSSPSPPPSNSSSSSSSPFQLRRIFQLYFDAAPRRTPTFYFSFSWMFSLELELVLSNMMEGEVVILRLEKKKKTTTMMMNEEEEFREARGGKGGWGVGWDRRSSTGYPTSMTGTSTSPSPHYHHSLPLPLHFSSSCFPSNELAIENMFSLPISLSSSSINVEYISFATAPLKNGAVSPGMRREKREGPHTGIPFPSPPSSSSSLSLMKMRMMMGNQLARMMMNNGGRGGGNPNDSLYHLPNNNNNVGGNAMKFSLLPSISSFYSQKKSLDTWSHQHSSIPYFHTPPPPVSAAAATKPPTSSPPPPFTLSSCSIPTTTSDAASALIPCATHIHTSTSSNNTNMMRSTNIKALNATTATMMPEVAAGASYFSMHSPFSASVLGQRGGGGGDGSRSNWGSWGWSGRVGAAHNIANTNLVHRVPLKERVLAQDLLCWSEKRETYPFAGTRGGEGESRRGISSSAACTPFSSSSLLRGFHTSSSLLGMNGVWRTDGNGASLTTMASTSSSGNLPDPPFPLPPSPGGGYYTVRGGPLGWGVLEEEVDEDQGDDHGNSGGEGGNNTTAMMVKDDQEEWKGGTGLLGYLVQAYGEALREEEEEEGESLEWFSSSSSSRWKSSERGVRPRSKTRTLQRRGSRKKSCFSSREKRRQKKWKREAMKSPSLQEKNNGFAELPIASGAGSSTAVVGMSEKGGVVVRVPVERAAHVSWWEGGGGGTRRRWSHHRACGTTREKDFDRDGYFRSSPRHRFSKDEGENRAGKKGARWKQEVEDHHSHHRLSVMREWKAPVFLAIGPTLYAADSGVTGRGENEKKSVFSHSVHYPVPLFPDSHYHHHVGRRDLTHQGTPEFCCWPSRHGEEEPEDEMEEEEEEMEEVGEEIDKEKDTSLLFSYMEKLEACGEISPTSDVPSLWAYLLHWNGRRGKGNVMNYSLQDHHLNNDDEKKKKKKKRDEKESRTREQSSLESVRRSRSRKMTMIIAEGARKEKSHQKSSCSYSPDSTFPLPPSNISSITCTKRNGCSTPLATRGGSSHHHSRRHHTSSSPTITATTRTTKKSTSTGKYTHRSRLSSLLKWKDAEEHYWHRVLHQRRALVLSLLGWSKPATLSYASSSSSSSSCAGGSAQEEEEDRSASSFSSSSSACCSAFSSCSRYPSKQRRKVGVEGGGERKQPSHEHPWENYPLAWRERQAGIAGLHGAFHEMKRWLSQSSSSSPSSSSPSRIVLYYSTHRVALARVLVDCDEGTRSVFLGQFSTWLLICVFSLCLIPSSSLRSKKKRRRKEKKKKLSILTTISSSSPPCQSQERCRCRHHCHHPHDYPPPPPPPPGDDDKENEEELEHHHHLLFAHAQEVTWKYRLKWIYQNKNISLWNRLGIALILENGGTEGRESSPLHYYNSRNHNHHSNRDESDGYYASHLHRLDALLYYFYKKSNALQSLIIGHGICEESVPFMQNIIDETGDFGLGACLFARVGVRSGVGGGNTIFSSFTATTFPVPPCSPSFSHIQTAGADTTVGYVENFHHKKTSSTSTEEEQAQKKRKYKNKEKELKHGSQKHSGTANDKSCNSSVEVEESPKGIFTITETGSRMTTSSCSSPPSNLFFHATGRLDHPMTSPCPYPALILGGTREEQRQARIARWQAEEQKQEEEEEERRRKSGNEDEEDGEAASSTTGISDGRRRRGDGGGGVVVGGAETLPSSAFSSGLLHSPMQSSQSYVPPPPPPPLPSSPCPSQQNKTVAAAVLWEWWADAFRSSLMSPSCLVARTEFDVVCQQRRAAAVSSFRHSSSPSPLLPPYYYSPPHAEGTAMLPPFAITTNAAHRQCGVCGEVVEHAMGRGSKEPQRGGRHCYYHCHNGRMSGGAHPNNIFVQCLTCGHGGHLPHIRGWFSTHRVCPVEHCKCCCNEG